MLQGELDLSDGQRTALTAAQRRYRGALRALAKERASINAALAAAAAPGKDGLKKVRPGDRRISQHHWLGAVCDFVLWHLRLAAVSPPEYFCNQRVLLQSARLF